MVLRRSVIYSAPELLEGLMHPNDSAAPTSHRTTAGDVYAFSMVVLEIFTGWVVVRIGREDS